MNNLEIFLLSFSIIISIVFFAMNAIHNYLDSLKNFVKYIREIESNTLHTRQLLKETREIAKQANELIYTCKANIKEKAVNEIECEDTVVNFDEFNDDTIIAFKRPDSDYEDSYKLNCEEFIYLRDAVNGG